MTGVKSVLLLGITLIYTFSLVASTPWLYNAPGAIFGLAGSASASASIPPTPESHIADLRKKVEKSVELQQDKEIVQQEELADDVDEESSGDGSGDNVEATNEASPSFLKKKAKLRLIAQIKNAYHSRKEISQNRHNLTFSITSVQNSTNHQIKKVDDAEEFDAETIPPTSQNIIQKTYAYTVPRERLTFPKEDNDEPTKVDLEINEINDKLQDLDKPERDQEPKPSRFGPLGVFFAELFGTLVGLTYGAVTQLTSGNQNPIVASTSPTTK